MLDSVMDDTVHHDRVNHEAKVAVATGLPTCAHLRSSVTSIGEASCGSSVQRLRLAHNTIVVRLSCLLIHLPDHGNPLPAILRLPSLPKLLRLLLRTRLILRIRGVARHIRAAIATPQHVLQLWLLLLQLL